MSFAKWRLFGLGLNVLKRKIIPTFRIEVFWGIYLPFNRVTFDVVMGWRVLLPWHWSTNVYLFPFQSTEITFDDGISSILCVCIYDDSLNCDVKCCIQLLYKFHLILGLSQMATLWLKYSSKWTAQKEHCIFTEHTFIFRCNIYLDWVSRPALSFQVEFECIGKEMSELGANTPKTIIFCRYVLKRLYFEPSVHFTGLKRKSYGYMKQSCTSFWVTVHSLVTPYGVISVEHSLR